MTRSLDGVVGLDLPLRVKNVDRAITMVGGSSEIARVSSMVSYARDSEPLQLQLRSNRFHHPVTSTIIQPRNIILACRIPTKCLIGTDCGPDLPRSLQKAKAESCEVEIIPQFRIEVMYRFRGLADFQWFTGNSEFIKETEPSIFRGNLTEIESLSVSKLQAHADILPPPRFSTLTQPFYYGYKQTPYLKLVDDGSGNHQLVHTVSSVKVFSNILTWGDPVPLGPPTDLEIAPRSAVANCIDELRHLFLKRPSYTRRWLQYYLGPVTSRYLKFALPYVAYYYRSGPWRGAYIRYGFDPALHTELAPYQVEHFRIIIDADKDNEPNFNEMRENVDFEEEDATPVANATSVKPEHYEYTFDGSKFPEVPLIQLSDIRDGFLEKYVGEKELRKEVHPTDGWYPESTITVIRRVLRSELVTLKESRPPLNMNDKIAIAEEL